MTAPGAIVVGGYVNALGLVRALAARRVPAAVVTTKPFDIAHRSRWAVAHHEVPDLHERPDGLRDLLDRHSRAWRGWAVLPTNDEAISALAGDREALDSTYRVVAPARDAARYLLDKAAMARAAAAAGVEVPTVYGPAVAATAARDDLPFPVLVKPLVASRFKPRFGAKLAIATTRAELVDWVARMEAAGVEGVVVDDVPGPDTAIVADCVFLDGRGAPVRGVTVRKLRQCPPRFGDARVAEVVEEVPELREATVAVARAIGLTGMAVAEFKRDERDGRWRFIEINGRSVVYNALLRRAGLDVAGLALGEPPAPRGPAGWRGVWIHLHPDVAYSTLDRGVGLTEFLAPYRRAKIEAVWSRRDPAPFAAQWGRVPAEAARMLRNRAIRAG